MRPYIFSRSISIFSLVLFTATTVGAYSSGAPTVNSQTLATAVTTHLSVSIPDPNEISEVLKNVGDSLVTDVSLEAFIPELQGNAQRAQGKGGLGFLTGETWGGYSLMKLFDAIGVMPMYDSFAGTQIDWLKEPGVNRVLVRDANDVLIPLGFDVEFNGGKYPVEIFWVNRKGTPVFLIRNAAIFKQLYPGGHDQERHYGFLARAYVELMKQLNLSPKVIRLSEPQLLFVAVAVENDVAFYEKVLHQKSVFEASRFSFTTHTPESAALPAWRGYDVGNLAKVIGNDLVDPVTNKDKVEWIVDAADELAKRAFIVNGVSPEHGDVTKQVIMPRYWWKTVAVQNASDPDVWYSPELAERVAKVGVKGVTGEELYAFGQQQKPRLNEYLKKTTGLAFDDLDRPLIGLVRRLVAYKEQGMLIPMLRWMTGDADTWYEIAPGDWRQGLGANVLIGGPIADEVGAKWTETFYRMAREPDLRGKFVFIGETGFDIMRLATSACDVWAAIPRLTREASGTSDERAALNGHWNLVSATGGPLTYVTHMENGWFINPFYGWDQTEIIAKFQVNDPYFVDVYRKEGARQMADGFIWLVQQLNAYREGKGTKWIAGMQDAFRTAHREVAIDVMVAKYELLFKSIVDGSGAKGYWEKMGTFSGGYAAQQELQVLKAA